MGREGDRLAAPGRLHAWEAHLVPSTSMEVSVQRDARLGEARRSREEGCFGGLCPSGKTSASQGAGSKSLWTSRLREKCWCWPGWRRAGSRWLHAPARLAVTRIKLWRESKSVINCSVRVNQKDEKGSRLPPGYCSSTFENGL